MINEDFARILAKNPNITLDDVLILDKVQKHKTLTETELKYLRKNRFIEGRKGSVYLSYKE